jgi:hypothetical protein
MKGDQLAPNAVSLGPSLVVAMFQRFHKRT